jgi:flagellar hook-associated protein 1 FlgK
MANILTIGQSALVAAQAGISTAGQNIANAATPGYSRQSVVQTAVTSEPLQFGYLGQGVQVTNVQRIYSDYLGTQKVSAQSASSELQIQSDQIQQLNNMLADPTAGLSPVMQNFFNGLQDVSTAPGDVPTREALLGDAAALTSRFHDLQGRLDDINKGVNLQITSSVQSINDIADQISALNQSIQRIYGMGNGNTANDLLDKRDTAIAELSKQIKVNVSQQNGQYNVYIGNGQPLVIGTAIHHLQAVPSATDPSKLEVAYDMAGQSFVLSSDNFAGGALGGLLAFRSKVLEPTENALGRIALGFASSINQINRTGFTASGTNGGDIFKLPPMSVSPSTNNKGTATVQASLSDSSKLTISDYRLQKIDDNYVLIRAVDNKVLKSSTDFAEIQSTAVDEGFNVNSNGSMNSGDEFLIRPTGDVASLMSLNIGNTNDIAAAGSSTSGVGDNSNIQKMIALQTAATLKGNGGAMNYQSAYATIVNQIGSKTRELEITSTSANSILSQADKAIQDMSGVNLDEEAASLLRYQQAYQAAGKVIQISQQMFDSLLQISR